MIRYLVGDATQPADDGPNVIAHICNDMRSWQTGFVRAISHRWIEPELRYLGADELPLGFTQFVEIPDTSIVVANMIAQRGDGHVIDRLVLLDFLEQTLRNVAAFARLNGAAVHMPRIGCGLGGRTWEEIGPIVERTCRRVPVTVYDPA